MTGETLEMKLTVRIVLLQFLMPLCVHIPGCIAANYFEAQVIKVIDGDSMLIRRNGKKIEVRLYGIDCPEHGQPFSNVAKKQVRRWVLGKTVRVEPLYLGKYGRLIGRIDDVDDQELSEKLVKNGLAWVHPAYCHKKVCKKWWRAQAKARKRELGLWLDPSPVPPWVIKRTRRSNR